MKFQDVLLASLAGSTAMSAFLYLASYATHRVMRVIKMLGTMLLFRTQPDGGFSSAFSTRVAGTVAHYLLGALFGAIYLALWDADLGTITASWSLFFGLASGIAGMFLWYFFLMAHPNPPIVSLKTHLSTLLVAYMVFAFFTFYTYYLIVRPNYSFWQ